MPHGTVATVNDRPIFLQDLKAYSDMLYGFASDQPLDLQSIQENYQNTLYELIAFELMTQALEKEKIPIAEKKVHISENTLQAEALHNFVDKEFVNDDELEQWHKISHIRIVTRVFQEELLRPTIHVSAEEIEKYYSLHATDFMRPEQASFTLYSDQEKEVIEKEYARLLEKKQEVQAVRKQTFTLPLARISPEWRSIIEQSTLNVPTAIHHLDDTYAFFVVHVLDKEEKLTNVEAYQKIEQLLLDKKEAVAYDTWLENTLKQAVIHISPTLLKEITSKHSVPNTPFSTITDWLKNKFHKTEIPSPTTSDSGNPI